MVVGRTVDGGYGAAGWERRIDRPHGIRGGGLATGSRFARGEGYREAVGCLWMPVFLYNLRVPGETGP